jgi:cytochrome P450
MASISSSSSTIISSLLQNIYTTPLTLTILFAISLYTIWMFFKSNKNKTTPPSPPGPRGFPVVGNLLSLDPELHTYFAGLAQTYGPIFQLKLGGKIGIIVTSPSLTKEILKDHDVTFCNRDVPIVVNAIGYGCQDIVWSPYGAEWRMLRKVCVLKVLSNTTLDSVYNLRRRQVRETVKYVYSRVGSEIDIGEQMFLTMLNVITNMLWGGTERGEERASIGAEFRQVVAEITELLGRPNVSDFFPGLARFDLQGLEKKMRVSAMKFDRIFDSLIDQRMKIDDSKSTEESESTTERKDFLQFLLKLKDDNDEKTPLTITHVKSLLLDMVVGGSDTSSNAVEFAMAEVINKPEVMKKAQQELDLVVGRDNIVEESHISKLPYLYTIMKETLRLHPTLPLLVPHCPSENVTIGGYHVPKGCRVFINVWAIHKDPAIWSNPLEFDPDRFENGQYDYSGNDFSYFPFGSGRRICAGIAMAERMFMYSFATLLHSFEWRLPEGVNVDCSEKFGIVLKLKNPLIAIPTPRLSNMSLYE